MINTCYYAVFYPGSNEPYAFFRDESDALAFWRTNQWRNGAPVSISMFTFKGLIDSNTWNEAIDAALTGIGLYAKVTDLDLTQLRLEILQLRDGK